ncbi:MAG: V-type ATPase subunit [Deltaproteobacteria bacterium]|nr:V-type ATPase subunit [Deltaproteobacteria bacterium]
MALKSRLFTPEDYYFLLKAGSLDEFLEYLATTTYGPALSDWDRQAPQADQDFSRRLYGELAQAYLKVARGLKKREGRFLRLLARRLVAENLKVVLRALHQGLSPPQAALLLAPLDGLTSLDFRELLRLDSIPALTEHLARTPWGPPLARGLPRYQREGSLFPLEMSLDLGVWQDLLAGVDDLAAGDRRLAGEMLNLLAEATNLVWFARFRELYGYSGEEIYQYLLEAGRFRKPRARHYLAFAPDLEAMTAALPSRPYGELLQGAGGVAELERRLQDYWLKRLSRVLALPPLQIGLPLAYVFLRELEIADLITMLTGLRLELPTEQVKPYLRGKAAGGRHV